MSKLIDVLKRTATEFSSDDCMSSGAAIAYYTIFSLPPLLVLVFFVAGQVFTPKQINEAVERQLGIPTGVSAGQGEGGEGSEGGSLLTAAQRSRQSSTKGPISGLGPLSHAIGLGILLFSATGVLAQLQFALNKAWGVEPDPEQGGILNFIAKRVLSLGMIVVVAFLLLVSLVLSLLIEEIITYISGPAPSALVTTMAFALNTLASLVVVTLLFASMFRLLPDAKMSWWDMWLGSAITAVLFIIGKNVIAWYLRSAHVGATWGSTAASTIGILVWVYYSSLIVLIGAEFTQSYAEILGHGIEPTKGAVRTTHDKLHIRAHEDARPRHPAYEP